MKSLAKFVLLVFLGIAVAVICAAGASIFSGCGQLNLDRRACMEWVFPE